MFFYCILMIFVGLILLDFKYDAYILTGDANENFQAVRTKQKLKVKVIIT